MPISFFLSFLEKVGTTIARWNLLLAGLSGLFNFFEISFKINTNCNFVIVIFSTFNSHRSNQITIANNMKSLYDRSIRSVLTSGSTFVK